MAMQVIYEFGHFTSLVGSRYMLTALRAGGLRGGRLEQFSYITDGQFCMTREARVCARSRVGN